MRESSLSTWLLRWLNTQPGTVAWKMHGSPWQRAGCPDVLCVQAGHLFAIEVKRPGAKLTRLQAAILDKLRDVGGATVAVVRCREDVYQIFPERR